MNSVTKTSSPDSVPSLSTTTVASTPPDDVARELFPVPLNDGTNYNRVYPTIEQRLQIEVDSESLFGSDISVASEGTHVSFINEKRGNRTTTGSTDDSDLKVFPGCHPSMSLTPNFASAMFNIFDSSQKKRDAYSDVNDTISTTDSVNDAVTEVASNIDHSIVLWERKIDSLEREISTLKGIIKSDSVTILRLKTALSAYQEKEVITHDLISEEGSELSTQQIKEYEETIQHLHDEIEVLTKNEDTNEQRLQLENKLFAAQIVESETEIRETREIISQIAEENVKLNLELSELRTSPVNQQQETNDDIEEMSSQILRLADVIDLKNRLADLEEKLEHGFYCHCKPTYVENNTTSTIVNEKEYCIVEHTESCESFANDDDQTMDESMPQLDELNGPDVVEVTIHGSIITATGMEKVTGFGTATKITNNDKTDQQPQANTLPKHPSSSCEVTETNCNFCDCLRAVSTTNESSKL